MGLGQVFQSLWDVPGMSLEADARRGVGLIPGAENSTVLGVVTLFSSFPAMRELRPNEGEGFA